MRYRQDVRLSTPEQQELEALNAPLTLDATASFENAALCLALGKECGAIWYIAPTVKALATSAVWRLMCEELLAASADPTEFRLLFLAHSARLMLAGSVEVSE